MTWDGTLSNIWYPPADQTGTEGCHPAGAETQADIITSAYNSKTSAEQRERSTSKHLTISFKNDIRKKGALAPPCCCYGKHEHNQWCRYTIVANLNIHCSNSETASEFWKPHHINRSY